MAAGGLYCRCETGWGIVGDEAHIVPFLGYNTGDYNNVALPPIPLEWIIAPVTVVPGQCPSSQATKLTFGLANLAVLILVLVFGADPSYTSSHAVFLVAAAASPSTGPGSSASASSSQPMSSLASSSCGRRGTSTSIWRMCFTLYASRPRLNVLWTAILRITAGVNMRRFSEKHDAKPEFVYTDTYISSALAEFFLQLISATFTGFTWGRFPDEPIKNYMKDIVGLICASPVFIFVGCTVLVPCWRRNVNFKKPSGGAGDDRGAASCFIFWPS